MAGSCLIPLVSLQTQSGCNHNCHTVICRGFTWPRRGSSSAWSRSVVLPCTPTSMRPCWESASSEPSRSRNVSSSRMTSRWMRIRKLIIQALLQTGTSGAAVRISSDLGRSGSAGCAPCQSQLFACLARGGRHEICFRDVLFNLCDEVKITSESLTFLRVPALLLGYILLEVLIFWSLCSESSCS